MCSNKVSRLSAWTMAVTVLACSSAATADALPEPQYAQMADVAAKVGDMLDIDTRIALHKEQQREREAMGLKQAPIDVRATQPVVKPINEVVEKADAEEKAPAQEKPKEPMLTLEGIFGPGDQLSADVLINGRKVRYRSGQRYPLGYDKSFSHQLLSINVPCVRLIGPKGPQKLCIDGVQEK